VPAVTDIRTLFCNTADAIGPLLAEAALEERFQEPSALAGFSVRGLTGHLLRAMSTVETYVDRPEPDPSGGEVLSAAEYYAAVLEPATADVNSDFHRAIRQRGLEEAPERAEELPGRWADLAGRLRARLATELPGRLVEVYGGLVLSLDGYVITRLIELVVHGDDLAASVGVEPPALSPAATGLVIGTLVDVARVRHGDLAVLRALTRRERDTVEALRVL
jgi:uncharacterized protein (TIGR03083 family)